MIGLEDRRSLAHDIDTAHKAGARLRLACETAGIDVRTLQRWNACEGLVTGDGRPNSVRPQPAHALSAVERAEVLRVANEARFADMPPARIVPMLADEGVYIASESTFARVLREHGQSAHRGRAKAPKAGRPPTTHIACAPREVWCWDMTYLPAGACQGTCRLSHAAKGCLSVACEAFVTTDSRSGLSVTAPMGVQSRVQPDQRAGLRSRAWTYTS